MIKQIVILILAVVIACPNPAVAEDTRVDVTLNSGEVLSGKVKKWWFGAFKKSQNTDMSIVDDNGQEHKLNAGDFVSMRLDDGQEFETCRVAVPALFKPKRLLNWILGVAARSDNGVVYWYNSYTGNVSHTPGSGGIPSRTVHSTSVVTTYNVKFAGDSIAYPFYYPGNGGVKLSILSAHLKEKNPELSEFIKSYMKKNKEIKKTIEDNPGVVLDMYGEYLRQKRDSE